MNDKIIIEIMIDARDKAELDAIILEFKRLIEIWKKENLINEFTAGQIDALKTAILICENSEYYYNLMKSMLKGNYNGK